MSTLNNNNVSEVFGAQKMCHPPLSERERKRIVLVMRAVQKYHTIPTDLGELPE
jgi:hypothetical protein